MYRSCSTSPRRTTSLRRHVTRVLVGLSACVLGGCGGAPGAGDGSGTTSAGGGSSSSAGGGATIGVPDTSHDDPMVHAAPTHIDVSLLADARGGVLDVGADGGGGVWAVDPRTVWFWPSAGATPHRFTAADKLARGDASHGFASVAGGARLGEAFVGNHGAIADHLVVDGSGRVVRVDNMSVPMSAPEYAEHLARVTSGIRAVVDPHGAFAGTAYIGGSHGFVAWHGVEGDCGCEQFQEHQHYIPDAGCDSTGAGGGCWGGDVRGLAISPTGDVWAGDEHFVSLLPQRSLGATTDFFQDFKLGIDVWPKMNDEVSALAVDGQGGVWVGSFGNGLAYLAPMTYQPHLYDRAGVLPQNRITGLAVDDDGSVWIGTMSGGVARTDATGSKWTYYTAASGLPDDEVRGLFIDRSQPQRRVLFAMASGVAVYSGK